MKRHLNWEDIQYLLRLIEERSVSAAARSLGVEHSTVVRHLNRLEEAVNAKLFDRLPRQWHPTEAAYALLGSAREMERQALSLERQVQAAKQDQSRVRISVTPLLAEEVLIPGLREFLPDHPEIALEVLTETSLSDIGRNEAEIALRLTRTSDQDLTTRRIASLSYGIFGLPELAAAPPDSWRWIAFDDNLSEIQLAAWYQDRLDPSRIAIRTGDFRAMAAAAVNGWGATLLPRFLARRYPSLVLLQDDVPTLDVALVTHRDLLNTPAVRMVCDEIIRLFRTAEF